jgi:hypothetical protein
MNDSSTPFFNRPVDHYCTDTLDYVRVEDNPCVGCPNNKKSQINICSCTLPSMQITY